MKKKKENQILLKYKKAYFKNLIIENLCKIGEFNMNNTNEKLADYSTRIVDSIKMNSKTSLKKYIWQFILTNNVIRQFENELILKQFPNTKYLIEDSEDFLDKIIKKDYNI